MKAVLGRLRYFATDAADEWRHSPGVNLLATATLAAALFLGGSLLLVLNNVSRQLDRWRADLRVQIFLLDGVSGEALIAIERSLGALAEVSRVEYIDKAEALRRFRESFGEPLASLPVELETNPLPASFDVYLSPEADAATAASRVEQAALGLRGVEEVRFDREFLDRLRGFLRVARVGGSLVSLVVLSAVALVMGSVVRLAVYARRDEIAIMQLVGATPGFVRGPFIVAGLAQGAVASAAALATVEAARRAVFAYLGDDPAVLVNLVAGGRLSAIASATIVAIGLAVGLVGACFAVRRAT